MTVHEIQEIVVKILAAFSPFHQEPKNDLNPIFTSPLIDCMISTEKNIVFSDVQNFCSNINSTSEAFIRNNGKTLVLEADCSVSPQPSPTMTTDNVYIIMVNTNLIIILPILLMGNGYTDEIII